MSASRRGKSDPHWAVYLMRGKRADLIGHVHAPDEVSAVERAVEEFDLEAWQRRRLLVRREAD